MPKAALAWLSLVAFLAIFAPLLANSNPLLLRELDAAGAVRRTWSPLLTLLTPVDVLLMIGAIVGAVILLLPARSSRRLRGGILLAAALQSACSIIIAGASGDRSPAGWVGLSLLVGLPFLLVNPVPSVWRRVLCVACVAGSVALVGIGFGSDRLPQFDRWPQMEAAGEATAIYTLIPWSPAHRRTELYVREPGTRVEDHVELERGTPLGRRPLYLGSDGFNSEVASQLVHGCRLSISVGFVSTGLAVLIGVTLGALMGYFGGWLDLLLYRVVEIFMAIPVLFLLIAAAGLLPDRSTYAMMAVIGLVSWTGAARYTRAEFLKLRRQEFVQAAECLGLPLRSVLFRHMLPNGVTPVLVDSSFAIAAAILAEATLSFLGLGPTDQASWGRLLSGAISTSGTFKWWLSILPGMAIFLTVLSYNVLGEALRDAIDPKLRKAAL
jgi:peptide/nickel transport system permease protein